MDKPLLCKKFGKPLAPELEFNFPEPDKPLLTSPSQNVPWAQWMEEVEDYCRKFTAPYPKQMDPNRFVMD